MFAHFLAKFNYPLSWKAVRLILKIFKQESERQHTQSTFRGEILCSSENLNASNLLNILDKNILKQTVARAFSSRVRHPVRDHVESDSLSNRPNILDYAESDKLFETLRIQTTLSETTVRRITHIVYVESVKHIVRDYAESNTLSKISQSQTHCLRLQRVRHVV